MVSVRDPHRPHRPYRALAPALRLIAASGLAAFATVSGCGRGTEPLSRPATVRVIAAGTHVARDDSLQLTAEVVAADSTVLVKPTVAWSSSDARIATVGGNGLVHGVTRGSAVITATSGHATGTFMVTVDDEYATIPAFILLSPAPGLLFSGATVQLTADVYNRWREPLGSAPVTWSTSRADVAAASASGLVMTNASGVAFITATSGSARDSVQIEVASAANLRVIGAITFVPSSASQLTVAAIGPAGGVQSVAATDWTSSDTTVLAIGKTGYAIARRAGLARVSASTSRGVVSVDVTSRALPGRIVYLSAGRLFSMTLDGTPATELQIAGVFAPRDPMLSSDGKRLALNCPLACWVTLDAAILQPVILPLGTDPSWNADGSTLGVRVGSTAVLVAPLAGGSAATYLTSRYVSRPRLSPNGQSLIYECSFDDPYDDPRDLCILDRRGPSDGLLRRDASHVAWAPNGLEIAFESSAGLCVARLEVPSACPVIVPDTHNAQPAWSPDGRFVLFSTDSALWMMQNDGTNLVQILLSPNASSSLESPSWGAKQ
jgi:hypothetical protein